MADAPPYAAKGKCIHYTGLLNSKAEQIDCCAAGVNYRDLAGGVSSGWIYKLPCNPISDPKHRKVLCSKRELPTDEQVGAWENWWEQRCKHITEAVNRCRADAGKARGVSGVIECPACKGKLGYTVARSNGHLWGKCETKDCLSWMS